jgi:hypothetical protein
MRRELNAASSVAEAGVEAAPILLAWTFTSGARLCFHERCFSDAAVQLRRVFEELGVNAAATPTAWMLTFCMLLTQMGRRLCFGQ